MRALKSLVTGVLSTADVLKRCATTMFAVIFAVGVATPAFATQGSVTGQVGSVLIVGSAGLAPGNYDFRVFLAGNPVICNGQTFAYVNVTDANYQSIVANILTARTTGTAISIEWFLASNGYCQIEYISW